MISKLRLVLKKANEKPQMALEKTVDEWLTNED
jgi:hypothetical protein